ncbi:unnamed protein product, partial [Musa acuminata subsp. burmannicoides]
WETRWPGRCRFRLRSRFWDPGRRLGFDRWRRAIDSGEIWGSDGFWMDSICVSRCLCMWVVFPLAFNNCTTESGHDFAIYEAYSRYRESSSSFEGKPVCGEQIFLSWSNGQPRVFQKLARTIRSHEPFYRGG